jgi:hypothetical protein
MNNTPLFALVASSGIYIIEAMVCFVCLIIVLRSQAIAADAARLGVAGFVCLLLGRIVSIGSVVMFTTMRDRFESVQALGLAMAGLNLIRVAVEIAGFICMTRALIVSRAGAQASA